MADLLALAMLAENDAAARVVLHDAIEESGWNVRANGVRVHAELYHPGYAIVPEWDGEHVREWFRAGFLLFIEERTRDFVSAIIVVLQDERRAPHPIPETKKENIK